MRVTQKADPCGAEKVLKWLRKVQEAAQKNGFEELDWAIPLEGECPSWWKACNASRKHPHVYQGMVLSPASSNSAPASSSSAPASSSFAPASSSVPADGVNAASGAINDEAPQPTDSFFLFFVWFLIPETTEIL